LSRRAPIALTLAAGLSFPFLTACAGGGAHSSAADAAIAKASDSEEREGLTQARDDIDAEMSAAAAERDAEIARLKSENDALRARLAARPKR
jgi:hypothetical protein